VADFLVGIVALGLGLAVCFFGLRFWFFMLPIWGFVAGFFTGAAVVTGIFGDGFLSTVTGWVLGLVFGLIFALLSYLFWYVGAIIAAASVGAMLGTGLMDLFGVNSSWVIFIVSLMVAIAFAFIALVFALPIYMVIVSTAMVGSTAIVAGVMLVFNQIDRAELHFGAVWAMIEQSWFWIIVWAVVAAIGIGAQMARMAQIQLPDDKWTKATPGYAAA
jgi:Domain of unknown function (DUF4203)